MAKGNIGNLLQHFIALNVVKRVVDAWQKPQEPIEYVDCYSMGLWEDLPPSRTPQRASFVRRCLDFVDSSDDFVAATFGAAWRSKYGRTLPTNIEDRKYPNTALLIRTANPHQTFRMRLHEIVDEHFAQLTKWARQVGPEWVQVDRDWTQSRLVHLQAAPVDRPTIVVLDPYRLVGDNHEKTDEDGYLCPRLLQYLIGPSALALRLPENVERTAPCVAILFSYSELDWNAADGLVRTVFNHSEWGIERVVAGPFPDVGNVKHHIAWVVSKGFGPTFMSAALQQGWEQWWERS